MGREACRFACGLPMCSEEEGARQKSQEERCASCPGLYAQPRRPLMPLLHEQNRFETQSYSAFDFCESAPARHLVGHHHERVHLDAARPAAADTMSKNPTAL